MKFYRIKYYPYISKKRSTKRHTIFLGIGGNVGDVKRRFQKLFIFFKKQKVLDIIKTSPILKNPPFGYINQDDFYNAIIILKTDMPPKNALKYFLKIEKIFKRVRKFKNSPRTLDLDIIFYDKITYKKEYLSIPHPKWKERDSVILPLKKIISGGEFLKKIRYKERFK